MISEAMILAGVTGAAGYLIYAHLPINMRTWLLNHPLVARVICALGTYTLFGASLHALFAAAFLDLGIGTLMAIQKDPAAKAALERLIAYLGDLRKKLVKAIGDMAKSLPVPVKNPELVVAHIN